MIFIGQVFQYQFAFGCLGPSLAKSPVAISNCNSQNCLAPTSKLGGQKNIIHFQMQHDVTN